MEPHRGTSAYQVVWQAINEYKGGDGGKVTFCRRNSVNFV